MIGSSGGLALMALDYQGGYQPNLHFEVVGNTVRDATGGIGVLIDGNPSNITLSIGHVVRDNHVSGHQGYNDAFTNFDGAITVGVDADDATCGCTKARGSGKAGTGGGCCFGSVKSAIVSVVVEGNSVLIDPRRGTCARNGVRVFADNTVARNNTCVRGAP